ncbi:MAG: SigE family RNA polymerase sigma factor [Dermatophilaceae bacterium]
MTISAVADAPGDLRRMSADAAIASLYAAHWSGLVRLAWLLVRDQGVAEDIVADALIALHRRWDHLADRDLALAYLRRSVVNAARSVLRHRTVERTYVAQHGRAITEATAPSAEHEALDEVGNAGMLAALDRLPRRQREVLVLRYYLDLSEAQIAHALEIAPGSVKAHASRGLTALRAQLGPDPDRTTREDR